jgi:single-strand DNA-binding protein
MSEVVTTLAGYVALDPKLFVSANGTAFTTFRMATTRRYFDRAAERWTDGQTLWFTVKTWRETARNVAESLRKGDAVVVTGVVGLDEWDGPDGPRTSFVLEARNLGPDLSRGAARFARVVHRSSAGDGEAGADGSGAGVAGETPGESGDDGAVDPWATDLAPEAVKDADVSEGDADAGAPDREAVGATA